MNVYPWLTVVVALCLLGAGGCTRLSEGQGMDENTLASIPDQESWDAELRTSRAGRPTLLMAAPYMARYEGRDTAYAVLGANPLGGDTGRVHVELFDDSGNPSVSLSARELTYFDKEQRFEGEGDINAVLLRSGGATLTANRLEYDEADGRFVATGDVLVVSEDGKQLRADEVEWDAAARQLRTHGRFQFVTTSERINGEGLVASEDLARYSFSRASGELEVKE